MTAFHHSLPKTNAAKAVAPRHRKPASVAPLLRATRFPLCLPVPVLELCLALAGCCMLLVAVFAPAVAQPEAYHAFADGRALAGVPFAMDVLSNAPFVAGGVWGLWRLGHSGRTALPAPVWVAAVVFWGGLVLTGVGSGVYHWQPDGDGLVVDRVAMGVAFAGLLGLAVADRVSGRAALGVTLTVLTMAPMAAALAWRGGNALPWLVLQMGGLLLLLALAAVTPKTPLDGGLGGLPLVCVVAIYALAKVFELGDHAVFDWTRGWVSGHTLKHVVAACVAFPLLRGLYGLRGNAATAGRMCNSWARAVASQVAQPFAAHGSKHIQSRTGQARPS